MNYDPVLNHATKLKWATLRAYIWALYMALCISSFVASLWLATVNMTHGSIPIMWGTFVVLGCLIGAERKGA